MGWVAARLGPSECCGRGARPVPRPFFPSPLGPGEVGGQEPRSAPSRPKGREKSGRRNGAGPPAARVGGGEGSCRALLSHGGSRRGGCVRPAGGGRGEAGARPGEGRPPGSPAGLALGPPDRQVGSREGRVGEAFPWREAGVGPRRGVPFGGRGLGRSLRFGAPKAEGVRRRRRQPAVMGLQGWAGRRRRHYRARSRRMWGDVEALPAP